jgi:CMP-N,N'-diacetyllegionaminic acid synthase
MLTLVTARGGSKRIPRKNLRPLAGVPLLLWTLLPFRHLDPVVSSDDAEILALARKHGFGVIERPAELATDTATSAAVALHAMAQRDERDVLLLQPTSPFRKPDTVDLALWAYRERGLPVVATRDLPHVYIGSNKVEGRCHAPVGTCFVIGRDVLERHQTFLPPGFVSVPECSMAALDIDTEDDWAHAEAIAASRVKMLEFA